MKKILFIALILPIAAFCQKPLKAKSAKHVYAKSHIKFLKNIADPSETIMSVPVTPSTATAPPGSKYQSIFPKKDAQSSVTSYNMADGTTPNIPSNGFSIPATDLLFFISDAIGTDGIKYVQFIIGQENTGTPPTPLLDLFVTGIGNMRHHVFIGNTLSDQSVLKCTSIAAPVSFEIPVNGAVLAINSDNRIPVKLLNAMQTTTGSVYSGNDASKMLDTYQKRTTKNITTTSFLYDAMELKSYISQVLLIDNKANIQLFLGEDNGRLSMIIIGVESDNATHIYFNDSIFGPCALEHCIPCPTCFNISDGGLKL